MGMFDKYNVFPTLKTKRIIIGYDDTVTVRGLLSTKDSKENKSTWLGTNRFTQYVKVCFVVVPDFLESIKFSNIYDSGTRFADGRSFNQLENQYITVSTTLDEILQNDNAISVGESDLEAGMVVNDISFELTIDMKQDVSFGAMVGVQPGAEINGAANDFPIFHAEQKWASWNANSWSLVGFIHFDYEKFQEDYSPVEHLKKLGGNCTVDQMLKRATTPEGKTYMKVPETIKAYFYAETWPRGSMHNSEIPIEAHFSEPYFGLAYYYDSESELYPDGPEYVGWVGGRYNDPEFGPKLNVIPIPNRKVIANHMIQAPVGQGDKRYMGAPMGWFYESYDDKTPDMNYRPQSPVAALSIDGVDSNKKVELLGADVRKTVEDFRRQAVYKSKAKSNVLFKSTASGIKVDPNPWRVSDGDRRKMILNSSCHQIVAFMDIKELICAHSPLGWLSEYHSYGDQRILDSFVNRSRIKKLTIMRKRLTNHPSGNNASGSPDHTTYDKEEVEKFIISTVDQIVPTPGMISRPSIVPALSDDEVTAMITPLGQAGFERGFYLEDYDLFHNVTFGNYEYSVEVDIIDGIKEVLEERVNSYYRQRDKMNEYISLSAVPVTYADEDPQSSDRENYAHKLLHGFTDDRAKSSTPVRGFYDYKNETYTSNFKTYAHIHRDRIQRFVRAFVECYKILERTPVNKDELVWVEYTNTLIDVFMRPQPGQIERYIDFFDKIASTMDGILGRGNISKYERITSGLLSTSLDTSKENRIINIKARIPEMVEAFSRTQVFYEPRILEMELIENRRDDSWNMET